MSNLHIVIPARAGSKGIPRKNLTVINGRRLVEYSMEAAEFICKSVYADSRVILTSDSRDILNCAEGYQVETCLRPDNLSTDNSLTVDAVHHALESGSVKVNEGDHVLLLQPTVPFRPKSELRDVINTYMDVVTRGFNSLVSLASIESYHPFRVKRLLSSGECVSYIDLGYEDMRPRQELPRCFIRSGSYYMTPVTMLRKKNSLLTSPTFGYVHDGEMPINIDTAADLELAGSQLSSVV